MRSVFFAIVPLIICCSELSLQGVEAQFPPVALALGWRHGNRDGIGGDACADGRDDVCSLRALSQRVPL